MGIQDRDWYRDLVRKRSGYKERASFRLPAYSSDDDDGGAYLQHGTKTNLPKAPLHPVWRVFLFIAICVVVFALLKLVSKFSA